MAKAKEEKNYHEGHRGRMRQRFDNDPEMMTFQEHEMLEYILNATIPRGDTNGIAHALIAEHGSLYGVFNAPVEDLVAAKGMTVSAAYLIAGIIPIIRKALRMSGENNMKKVLNYGDAADFFHTFFMSRNTECLCVLYMGMKYNIIKTVVVNDLSPMSVSVNTRTIAATAVKCGARFVMIGHNHPSGSPLPSENDFLLLWDLFNVLAGLDVIVLDNFIFTEQGFLSFRNVGILQKFANEYNQRNPSRVLREDNKELSVYVTKLKQYLIKVSKLKEENLAEIVAVDDFIKQNYRKINDVRTGKTDFEKSKNRKPISFIEKKIGTKKDDGEVDMLVKRGEKEIIEIAKGFNKDNCAPESNKQLRPKSIETIVYPGTIEEKSADGKEKDSVKKQRAKISASTRNIPEFVSLFNYRADKAAAKAKTREDEVAATKVVKTDGNQGGKR